MLHLRLCAVPVHMAYGGLCSCSVQWETDN